MCRSTSISVIYVVCIILLVSANLTPIALANNNPKLQDVSWFAQTYYSYPNCTGPATGPESSAVGACYQGRFDFNFYCSSDGQYGYALEYAETNFQCATNNIVSVQQIPLGCIGGVLTQCTNSSIGPFMPFVFPPPGKSYVLQTDCTSLGVDTCTSPAGMYNQSCVTNAWNAGMCTISDSAFDGTSTAFFCSANGEWAGWLTSEDEEQCQKGNYSTAILHHTECTSGMQFECTDASPPMPAPPSAAMLMFRGNGCNVTNAGPVYLSNPNECGIFPSIDFTSQLICNSNGTITVNWWSEADSTCPSQPMSSALVQEGACVDGLRGRALCGADPPCSAIFSCAFGKDWEMSRDLKEENKDIIDLA